tara:strand:+ start:152 stop:1000 length:849 start_codon:yes stop_codon:yes gene_type:complete
MDVQIDNVSNMPTNYDYMNNIGTNPWSLIFLSGVIMVYYLIFATLGSGKSDGGEGGQSAIKSFVFLEVIIWGVFIALLLLNGIQYFFDIDVTASIKNYFSAQPEIDIAIDNLQPSESSQDDKVKLGDKSEVFHIPGNTLVYKDAKALCDAYGARLATYDEIEDAYNKGAEWCSYGWSENQLALFPTQKKTYDHLQTVEGHENDCGRTGVNGGFIANPAVRFGANCFGYKPKITSEEQDAMDNAPEYPKTRKDMAFERRVDYWRQKLPEVTVAPFNKSTWSKV